MLIKLKIYDNDFQPIVNKLYLYLETCDLEHKLKMSIKQCNKPSKIIILIHPLLL